MRFLITTVAVVLVASAAALLAIGFGGRTGGRVKVTVARTADDKASGRWHVGRLPPPSAADAATAATFTLASGELDKSSGGLALLNDGYAPPGRHESREFFYFDVGTPGGRVVADVGRVIPVKQVITYSWAGAARACQVYKLYGSDGAATNFDSKPPAGRDPAAAGWVFIAGVDGRSSGGRVDGQQAVCVERDDGTPLGRYRYLLLDVAWTDPTDAWSNTFYAEIDVVGSSAPAPASAPAPTEPAATEPAATEPSAAEPSEAEPSEAIKPTADAPGTSAERRPARQSPGLNRPRQGFGR